MALYQKYRSKKFLDLVGQGHISQTLRKAAANGNLVHAYLLTGSRGIGKTTTARLIAKAANCLNLSKDGEVCDECESCKEINEGKAIDIMEIDAASHTGVDDVREIIEKARLAPAKSRKKVYIIDEVHMLSKSAFNALLKTLEEPPSQTIFIMATTEIHKIPGTILSRAQRYDFKRATRDDIVANLKRIAKAEGIEISDESLDILAVKAEGSHRDAVGLLEQVSSFDKQVKNEDVLAILGIAKGEQILSLIRVIFNGLPEEGLKIARAIYEEGLDISDFFHNITEALRKILLLQISGKEIFEETKETIEKLKELASLVDAKTTEKTISIFLKNSDLLKGVGNPLLPLDMAIVEANDIGSEKVSSEQVSGKKMRNDENSPEEDKKQEAKPAKIADSQTDDSATLPIKNSPPPTPISSPSTPNSPLNTASAVVVEMTEDIWEKVIETVKEKNSTLAALLKDAKPLEVTDGNFVIGAKFQFHKEKIAEPKHIKILESVIKACTGNDFCVTCKVADLRPIVKKPATDNELIAAAEEIFEIE